MTAIAAVQLILRKLECRHVARCRFITNSLRPFVINHHKVLNVQFYCITCRDVLSYLLKPVDESVTMSRSQPRMISSCYLMEFASSILSSFSRQIKRLMIFFIHCTKRDNCRFTNLSVHVLSKFTDNRPHTITLGQACTCAPRWYIKGQVQVFR